MAIPVPTNDTLRREAKIYLKHKGNVSLAAEELGVARSTLRDHMKLAMQEGVLDPARVATLNTAQASEVMEAEKARQVLQNKKIDAEKRALLKASQDEVKRLEEQVEELQRKQDIMLAIQNRPRAGRIPSYESSSGNAIPIIILSDLHLEETVLPGQVPGCDNVFNLAIGEERLRKVFQHGQFMVDTMRGMCDIDTLCLGLLGDHISGFIHEELAETNGLSPVKATLHAAEHLSRGIEYLLANGDYKKIIIPATVGNHGRTTDKMRIQNATDHSFEYLLYRMLEKEWQHEKRLEWHIATGYHQYVQLFNTTCRFHHGDNIKLGGGVGGMTIPVRKAIANWNTVHRADLDLFGHVHQFTDGGDFVSNGSLIGYNPYALSIRARFERPRQAFVLIDQQRGKTLTAEIFAE